MREMLGTDLRRQVFLRYDNKCYVCNYSSRLVLRVHHIIPVSLGGKDEIENLVLLCANCHALTHAYSAKRFAGQNVGGLLQDTLNKESIQKLIGLTARIHTARNSIQSSGGIWSDKDGVSRDAYSLEEAGDIVASKNKYSAEKTDLLKRTLDVVVRNIPDAIASRCSYRLLKEGRYISINIMNYLLFRAPAYGDLRGEPYYDTFVIFPLQTDELQIDVDFDEREAFQFANFDCVNLGLFFEEVLAFSSTDWNHFAQACLLAASARRTREWVSNIRMEP